MENLECRYDRRKSFYGKAKVEESRGITTLYSYGEKIVSVKGNKVKKIWNGYSMTTQRHIVEFLLQKVGYHIDKNKYENIPCDKWIEVTKIC